MSHGFTKQHIIDGIVRDDNAASPASFENNLAAGSNALRLGTTLTANVTPHTKAATYTTLIASTAQIANGIWVTGFDVGVSATITDTLLDIAKGAAASEVDIIQNIDMGGASPSLGAVPIGNGKLYYFPGITIPAGTRISGRTQATVISDTMVVALWLDYRAQWQIGNAAWVTYGADTANSRGTSVPKAANAFGAWTAIGGVTSRNHNLFAVGYDGLGDTTLSGSAILIEIGYGPDAGNVTSIGVVQTNEGPTESLPGCFPPVLSFVVASGSQLWARIAGDSTENRGIIIYGN